MSARNWAVMPQRTQRGEYVRNPETARPGWPYQIIGVAVTAEPRVTATTTTPPEEPVRHDEEPPLHRRRTSVAAEPQASSMPKFKAMPPMPEPKARPLRRTRLVLTTGVNLVRRWFK